MSNRPDPARSLLIVEDDDRLRERLARALRERGYETREARDYDAALAAARASSTISPTTPTRSPQHSPRRS